MQISFLVAFFTAINFTKSSHSLSISLGNGKEEEELHSQDLQLNCIITMMGRIMFFVTGKSDDPKEIYPTTFFIYVLQSRLETTDIEID